ncbi:prolyl oligopeptidase [Ferrithrix thermotolerans DSM 19514]|uniref:prolyl oligopeptidase n=1 Tax=Ferrithrix thermotolerans DSM 19514 TaxID=1121881 RepID=A0A1M4XH79_9ACTN|nr:prolyl oligopeptidase family serine peptidase [Ferrithrix thermotolerans]SHE92760.1 prolyl oligopeptidase [Ferrithrix thermotolerans DSM 19514]
MDNLEYPAARRCDVVDHYFGEAVPDPYRWLEDTNSTETKDWIAQQNALTQRVLKSCLNRDAIRARTRELWNFPKAGVPFRRGVKWFQTRNSGLQNQSVLVVGDEPCGEARTLIDPNPLSDNGTVALTQLSITHDGLLVAYAVSESGSDWMTWRIRDVSTGQDLQDLVQWSKFMSVSWRRDKSGFFYAGMDQPLESGVFLDESRGRRILFHSLGTSQRQDEEVFSAPNQPDWLPSVEVSNDDRYLFLSIHRGTGVENMLLVKDLAYPDARFQPLCKDFSCKAQVVGNEGTRVLILTDRDAERQKIVELDVSRPEDPWLDVVKECEDILLEAQICGGKIVCHYLRDAQSVLKIYERNGVPSHEIAEIGSVSLTHDSTSPRSFEGDPSDSWIYFQTVSFVESGTIWRHNVDTKITEVLQRSASILDPNDYVTERVFVESQDGTKVPMFLIHGRDMVPRGDGRVLMYGYGGFNIPVTPSFSLLFASWLDSGGVVAVTNLRGGGEFGTSWHDSGRLGNKQNVFDDYCACARWLTTSGWSTPGRTAISGASNGGLLVGACITQHPELFGAAISDVGVYDMLRFDKFTVGWAWRSDYGSPNDPEQYRWLKSYSPLHNVTPGTCYPPTFVLTGDHDDRVVPGHSLKFAATLQAAQGCDRPILLRVAASVGHGLGKPVEMLIDEVVDKIVFLETAMA